MKIAIETHIAAPVAATWRAFNEPVDILQWDTTDEWHTTRASNNLTVGGRLTLRIEANDGSTGFDFGATYTQIELNHLIEYREDEGRMVRLEFIETATGVTLRQTFDADATIPEEQERAEWLAVLHHFARHVELQYGMA